VTIVSLAAALSAAALLLTVAAAAGTTTAGRSAGRIVFMRPGTVGEYDLWTVRGNGTQLRRLTRAPRDRSDYNPDWSPDGSTVVFERRVLTAPGDELYLVRADGSGLHPITSCTGDCWSDNEARWSPDGRLIAFGEASGPRTDSGPAKVAIDLVNADGSGQRQLSNPPHGFEDHYPTWSAEGKTIVFQRDTSTNPLGRTRLVAIDVSTGREQVIYTLPSWANGGGVPTFSPDGRRILFSFWCIYGDGCAPATRQARNARLATVDANGGNLHVLPLKTRGDSGAWSPRGRSVVFRCWAKTGLQVGNFRLCTSRLDGTRLKRFPWRLDSAHPDWGR
jgi:Tol biopolymer transport system component